jgi:hypothetical protein
LRKKKKKQIQRLNFKERKEEEHTPQLALLLPLDHHPPICCEVSAPSENFVHIRTLDCSELKCYYTSSDTKNCINLVLEKEENCNVKICLAS